ncbi:ester cyclase [Leisingera aquaemixtae]|uniref:Ester cyclase n=1 Tax=Leisingera aquaemixtae TaxID=1396826 RepID=A0ABY5WM66_9RHOB|nr:ester cyclase [Leisingera aquaemixtae]UWQ42469.1 ester cyclase [Leisingera aquaemixtae]
MSIKQTAHDFCEACDAGKGWDVCKQWCVEDATFSVQADALAEITTLADYTEWAKGLLTPMPDAHAEFKSLAVDEDAGRAILFAVFHGTHTADAGNGAPTGRKVASDYVYVLDFDGQKIRGMTKVWNDVHALTQLGWM